MLHYIHLKALKLKISICRANQQGTADAKSLAEQFGSAQGWDLQSQLQCGIWFSLQLRVRGVLPSYQGHLGTLNLSEEWS